jgi:hypothetical protein
MDAFEEASGKVIFYFDTGTKRKMVILDLYGLVRVFGDEILDKNACR